MKNIIAVDVGGTHTDSVLLRSDGQLFTMKVRSTPDDPGRALLTAVDDLLGASRLTIADVDALVHGTTVATNAVIQADFARVALITTAGFEDILTVGTQQRADLYNPWEPIPVPLVPRRLVVGAKERVGADGAVVRPLDEAELVQSLARLRDIDAIAVSLLFSFVNPAHERRIAELIDATLPGVEVSLSSEIAPEFREFPRTTTTALNAALLPGCGTYIAALSRRLRDRGFVGSLQIMTSGGGIVPAAVAQRFPAALLVSGPAAAAVAAARIGADVGRRDLVMLDVGGTSADIAIVTDGHPRRRFRGDAAGMPVALPQIDVTPIGAGGGSVITVDEFSSLAVGPDSLGADPGPACYGKSTAAALTDAYVVRGLLGSDGLLGGALPLDVDRSHESLGATVAEPLGIALDRAAVAATRIANAKMADTIRALTLAQGIDVRECALLAFGGAGPIHACEIADELGVRTVLVPSHPGLTAALGLLMGEIRYEVSRTHVAALRSVDPTVLRILMTELADRARTEIGQPDARIRVEFDVRYAGQAYELTVPVHPGLSFTSGDVGEVERAFTAMHLATYGHSWDDAPIELVTIRVSALQETARVTLRPNRTQPERQTPRVREVVAADGAPSPHRILHREAVSPGLAGPAVIEQLDTTVLIPDQWTVTEVHPLALTLERTGHADR